MKRHVETGRSLYVMVKFGFVVWLFWDGVWCSTGWSNSLSCRGCPWTSAPPASSTSPVIGGLCWRLCAWHGGRIKLTQELSAIVSTHTEMYFSGRMLGVPALIQCPVNTHTLTLGSMSSTHTQGKEKEKPVKINAYVEKTWQVTFLCICYNVGNVGERTCPQTVSVTGTHDI